MEFSTSIRHPVISHLLMEEIRIKETYHSKSHMNTIYGFNPYFRPQEL